DQAAVGHVVALNTGTLDVPGSRPAIVGEIADEPMSGDRRGNARRDAPDKPGHAADGVEQDRPGQLLRHEGAINKLIEAVVAYAPLEHELGRMRERELAVQLPIAVAQDRGTVCKVWMAGGLALRPVANVVLADHAIGARHPDQRTEIDE